MKKLVALLFAVIMLFAVMVVPASAATAGINENEQAVLDYWSQVVEDFKVPDDALSQAERYFATSFDMTVAQKDYIIAQTDRVLAIIREEKKSDLSDFSAENKSAIASIVFETGEYFDINVVYNYSTNLITMTDGSGTIFVKDATLIKKTGRALMPWVLAGGLLLVSGLAVGIKLLPRKSKAGIKG